MSAPHKTVLGSFALLLIWPLLLACASLCKAGGYEYKVTGVNIRTQERVVGHIEDAGQNGTLTGIIWDKTDTYPVEGTWDGKGLIRLHSRLSAFSVEVVEE